jgi:Family of unknown function (DUF6515)
MDMPKTILAPLLALALAVPLVPAAARAGDGHGLHHGYERYGDYHGDRHGDRGRHDGHDRRGHDRDHRPDGYVGIWLDPHLTLFWNAAFVGPYGHDRLVPAPAIGVRVRQVPAGYVRFTIGPGRYFFAGGAYYVWDARHRDYLVVPKPIGAEAAMRGPGVEREAFFAESAGDRGGPVREWDRYACNEWASGETGGAERAAPGSAARERYLRAVASCLEGRGYGGR